MPVEKIYRFVCDDHGHEETDPPGDPYIMAGSIKGARVTMAKRGWRFDSRDGRCFCPDCNKRASDKMFAAHRAAQGEEVRHD